MQTPRPKPGLQVALVGAFNAWLDHTTLIAGLDAALQARPDLHICCIGANIESMPTGGYEAVCRWAQESSATDRIHVHGWVPQSKLPDLLRTCNAGVWMDRAGDEPLLGSRTRALLYGWMGLQLIGTPSTELATALEHAGHLVPVPVGDAEQLCQTLLSLQSPEDPARTLARQDWMADRYGMQRISRPLLDWAAAPMRCRSSDDPSAALAADHARIRDELHTMRETPTWRLLAAAQRALGKHEP